MNDALIIRMANDIATNVNGWVDATEIISEHINKFWSPPMRKRIFELHQDNPSSFHDNVVKALSTVRCNEYNPIKVEFKDKTGSGG